MNGIVYLFKYTWKFRKKYIIFSCLQQLISSLVPLMLIVIPAQIIDELLGGRRMSVIFGYVAVMVTGAFFNNAVCAWLRKECFALKGLLFVDFQEMIARRLAVCDYQKLEDPVFLDTKEKAKKFLFANGQGFGEVMDQAFQIVGNIITFIGIISIIVHLHFAIVIFLVLLVLLNAYVDSRVKGSYAKLSIEKAPVERRTNYLIAVMEDFSYGKEIRLLGIADWFAEKVRTSLNASQIFYKKQMGVIAKGQYVAALTNLVQTVFSYGVLCWQVTTNRIGVGEFTMYLSAINNFSSAMNTTMGSIASIRQFSGYYEALREYMDVPSTMDTGTLAVPEKIETLEFRNVSFRYPGQESWSLRNINLKLENNKRYSIVGENGAGKTTLIMLACRLYDPTEGEILLNGVNIREYALDGYMKLFSTVFQDYKLFSFSIEENILFGQECEEGTVVKLLEESGFGEKLGSLGNGIKTGIHKDFDMEGFEPSGGEGQKIALARALYQDRPVIILDEPTAALDPKAEYELYHSFDKLIKDKMTLYISHRMASSRFCDYVLVFSKGNVMEMGTHEELIGQKGLYYDLYMMQAQYYIDE